MPAVSSLKIVEKDDGPGYAVLLKEVTDGDGPACDHCAGLDIPLCMEYCREYDDLYLILQKFKANEPRMDDGVEMEGVGDERR